MIYIKPETKRVNDWKDDSIYVLTDFDRTITKGSSNTSWSIISKSSMVPKEYVEERQKLYDYYRPIELNESMPYEERNRLMSEWWNKHISLFVKYKMSEEVINNAAKDFRVMSFRDGAKEMLKSFYERGIPVIIISAGIGNFIKEFLVENDSYYSNIFIVSNFIKFEDGIAVGVQDNVTHSLNKNEVALTDDIKGLLKNRKNVILLGDSLSDIRMVSKENKDNALKIGFLEEYVEENMKYFLKEYDIVCTDNTTFYELWEKIPVLKRKNSCKK